MPPCRTGYMLISSFTHVQRSFLATQNANLCDRCVRVFTINEITFSNRMQFKLCMQHILNRRCSLKICLYISLINRIEHFSDSTRFSLLENKLKTLFYRIYFQIDSKREQ